MAASAVSVFDLAGLTGFRSQALDSFFDRARVVRPEGRITPPQQIFAGL